ncbi:hypothetical protein L6452_14504 [Arctium lappa]|uniref:Uncharacterized protein n=1 Tax=Arctium lappa TaxID=4217 RepID=A0ACB9CLG8_ARCLA|nr:hypothetical protein L6452_14504 [Arctium lappa]
MASFRKHGFFHLLLTSPSTSSRLSQRSYLHINNVKRRKSETTHSSSLHKLNLDNHRLKSKKERFLIWFSTIVSSGSHLLITVHRLRLDDSQP